MSQAIGGLIPIGLARALHAQQPAPDSPAALGGMRPVEPGSTLRFPRDHGAHPALRTEWWYLTGRLRGAGLDPEGAGFQVTFFRSRTGHGERNPSAFAPRQLILAHAALALPENGQPLHAQRGAREGFGLASAANDDTDVSIRHWRLRRRNLANGERYQASIDASRFMLELSLSTNLPPVLQGDAGYSRKGPLVQQASYYYSRPQLKVDGMIRWQGRDRSRSSEVQGRAWLDHEWSSELLDPAASGWDWCGLNFDDGSSLMAFRIRARGGESLWANARWIDRSGRAIADSGSPAMPAEPRFDSLRSWRSPRSGISYPVAMRLSSQGRQLELRPLMDDQEVDGRATTGNLYWEGAVTVLENGRPIGDGYLELTGYADRVWT